jgi:gluconate 5-dehydrogenase
LAVNSRAVEVLTENNKVVGVKVMSPDKKAYFIKAKTIILATSTLETPRILLNSGIQGRAIGHYLTDHSFVRGVGIVNRKDFSEMLGTLNLWIPQTGNRSYGIHIFGPGAFKAYSYREMPLMDTLEIYLHAYGKNESKYENMVSLDPNRKDKYGVPQIQVSFSYSDRDQAVIQQAEAGVKQSSENMGASLKRDGHSETTLLPPGSDNHEAGTCRMGDDPTTSATNRVGQIHGVTGLYVADNSVLPSIGGTNPTLTTIALAIRTADYIIRELS